jgi:hypothetical protein
MHRAERVNCCFFCLFQKRGKAQHLLDKVFEHLELIEKDYFGCQVWYVSAKGVSELGMFVSPFSVVTVLSSTMVTVVVNLVAHAPGARSPKCLCGSRKAKFYQ